eukprot:1574347-Rhodomonas_salina.2
MARTGPTPWMPSRRERRASADACPHTSTEPSSDPDSKTALVRGAARHVTTSKCPLYCRTPRLAAAQRGLVPRIAWLAR